MAKIYKNTSELIGSTPLLELSNIESALGLKARLIAKVESFNPAGSIKDRVALSIIKDAEDRGLIDKDTTIIEPTSGNTGIGIASIAASRGYKAILVMPDSMSIERRNIIKAYGAKLVLTPAKDGMKGSIAKAEELKKEIENAIIAGQFVNNANPIAHYKTTGPEIYNDTDGNVDIFISAVGTGGTITGCGKYLKEKNPNIKVVAVEPRTSPVLSGGQAGPHKIQGIGAGFVPAVLDRSIIDEIECVGDEEAFAFGRMVAGKEGLLVGISSGAALAAAVREAEKEENKGKTIVIIFPDTGDRYLSSAMFREDD